jgi:hypothetical protein
MPLLFGLLTAAHAAYGAERREAAPPPPIVLPMGRHCYVVGEEIPLGFRDAAGEAKLEAVWEGEAVPRLASPAVSSPARSDKPTVAQLLLRGVPQFPG